MQRHCRGMVLFCVIRKDGCFFVLPGCLTGYSRKFIIKSKKHYAREDIVMNTQEMDNQMNRLMGNLFYQIRIDKGLSQEDVARNIVSQKTISKFEKMGDMPNCLVLCALMQRMGDTMDYFTTMLSKQEYEYFAWRKKVLKQIQENQVDESVWSCKEACDFTLNANLQEQFLKFWKGYCKNDVELMKEAIFLTIENPAAGSKWMRCMSTTEIAYLLIYLEKRAQLHEKLESDNSQLLCEIVTYLEENTEDVEKVKLYGKAVSLFGNYVPADSRQKLFLYKKALELQRKYARLDGMTALLKGLLEQYHKIGIQEEENYTEMLRALTAVKKEFGVREHSFVIQELNAEYVLLHEVLKSYRQERRLSVSEIDEQACSEKTYRALEKGKRAANHSTYEILAELMDIRIGKYHADIISDKYFDYKLAGEIETARRNQRQKESMLLLDKLEKSLGDLVKLNVNKQFIARWRTIQDLYDNKIEPQEFMEKIKEAVRLTIPQWDFGYGAHFYLKTEMMLVYYLAIGYRMQGKTKEALDIIQKLWNIYDTREVDAAFNMDERLLFLVFWKNLMTDLGEYGKALEMAKIGIKMSFDSGKGGKLNNFVTEMGWSLEHGRTEISEKDRKAQYTPYYRNAMALCKLFRLSRDEIRLSNYCEERNMKFD